MQCRALPWFMCYYFFRRIPHDRVNRRVFCPLFYIPRFHAFSCSFVDLSELSACRQILSRLERREWTGFFSPWRRGVEGTGICLSGFGVIGTGKKRHKRKGGEWRGRRGGGLKGRTLGGANRDRLGGSAFNGFWKPARESGGKREREIVKVRVCVWVSYTH